MAGHAAGASVTFTLDLEDHRLDRTAPRRYPAITRELLDLLAAREVRGTFFVTGEVAEDDPGLVREVASRGHEIGLHSYHHVPLTQLTPEAFRAETKLGRELLERLSGREVVGYRAPTFSLVRTSLWATELLTELGFAYSSSILPARNPLFGFPGCPDVPFRWPSGLVEVPCPVLGIGALAVPFLGGVFLRVLPWGAVELGRRRHAAAPLRMTYCHPYDFDPDEPFWAVEAHWWENRLLWAGRRRMRARMERLLDAGAAPPLVEQVRGGLELTRPPDLG